MRGPTRQLYKNDRPSFKVYIYRVVKLIFGDTGISSNAIDILNDFCYDMMWKICTEVNVRSYCNSDRLKMLQLGRSVVSSSEKKSQGPHITRNSDWSEAVASWRGIRHEIHFQNCRVLCITCQIHHIIS